MSTAAKCAREGQGSCSSDRFLIYFGLPDPITLCGKHEQSTRNYSAHRETTNP